MEKKTTKKVKFHLKSGDKVFVIAGDDKGKQGTVLSVDIEKHRAIVEGLNIVKKHIKPSANNPQGSIEEREAPIHISNLMVIDPTTDKPARSGRKRNEKGKLERYFKKPSKTQI